MSFLDFFFRHKQGSFSRHQDERDDESEISFHDYDGRNDDQLKDEK